MNKIPNGNWEDDKEICHQLLQDGYDVLEILEMVYKYGFVDGRQEGLNQVSKIINRGSK